MIYSMTNTSWYYKVFHHKEKAQLEIDSVYQGDSQKDKFLWLIISCMSEISVVPDKRIIKTLAAPMHIQFTIAHWNELKK